MVSVIIRVLPAAQETFENESHEKAWFIRVTINACKDLLKSFFRRQTVPIDEITELPATFSPRYYEIFNAVEDCISHHENAVCYSGNSEEAREAHDCGLSLGKYRAFLELKELDPNITPEDIQGWSMKEIQNRISELSDGETRNASSSLEETSCEETSASGHHKEQKHKGHHWD